MDWQPRWSDFGKKQNLSSLLIVLKCFLFFFEALMFLNFNQQYWDIFTLQREYSTVIKESRAERLGKKTELHNEAETNDAIID